jgi:adenylyltransferase/sulfurtransferase
MPVTVSIPTPLRSFTGGRDAVELAGSTVGEVIDGLLATHGGLKRHLVQEDGRLRNFVNLYLNDTDIRHLDSTDTPVHEGDVLTIVPSIAGGRPAVETREELPKLSHAEVLRYSRHLLLPEVGVEGQRKLKAARRSRCTSRPPGWVPSASWTSTSWTSPTSSARSCTGPRPWAGPSWSRPRRG